MIVNPEPPAIEVENLSTSYRVRLDSGSLWAGLSDLLRRVDDKDRIVPALRNVNLTVPRGTVLGVIGRNGAGKSTLLRCMAGILPPEEGRVTVRGRISSLLTIGVGMRPKLTGRENIRLGGLAVGLTDERISEIIGSVTEFAQLGEYVDFPVETYSTGMRSRLGFALVAHLDPEVLLIDEALSGGDTKFSSNVSRKMAEICGNGRTIVLVSHGMKSIQEMATSAVWIHQGKVIEYGDPQDVVASYMRFSRMESLDSEMDF